MTAPAPEADWLTPLLAKIAEISDDTLRDWVLAEVLDALPHCDGADVRVPRGGRARSGTPDLAAQVLARREAFLERAREALKRAG